MKTILLVEDDRRLAAHWQAALEAEGYRVLHESSVEGAIDAMDSIALDLVITDIVLESEDEQLGLSGGLAVISYIALKLDPQPAIIATSGDSTSTFVGRNFSRLNSMRRLRKPVEVQQLLGAVKALLKNHTAALPEAKSEVKSSLRSRMLLELLGETDGVWDWEIGTDFAEYSAGWRRMLGFDEHDIESFPNNLTAFSDRIHPEDKDDLWAAVDVAIQNQEPFIHEFRLRNAAHEYIWVQSRATVNFDAKGNATRLVGATHDITQRKAAESGLKRLSQLVQLSHDAIFSWTLSGGIQTWNEGAEQLYGFTEQEAIGRITHSFLYTEHPETWQQILKTLHTEGQWTGQLQHRSKDGRVVTVATRKQIIDIDGTEVILETNRDMTEIVEAQSQLVRGQFFLENSQDAIYWVTEDSSFVYVNEAATRMLGHSREQLLQMRVVDIDPDYPPDVWAEWWEQMRNDQYKVVETQHIHRDGPSRDVEVSVYFITHEGVEHLVGVTRDITERKRAIKELKASEARLIETNESLERVNKDLEQFAYVASHDLKQPLRGIDQLAEWVTEDSADALSDSSRQHLAKLRRRVKRLEQLLDDLLGYSRAQRFETDSEIVDTLQLVQSVGDLLAAPSGFRIEAIAPLPTLQTQRAPLEQILRNLIGNSIKHSESDSGTVQISATVEDEWVTFKVKDDGPGIAPEFHERVFQMFHTLKPRDQVEGSGMGLALVKKLVQSVGGEISLESELGQGVAISFTWPATGLVNVENHDASV